MAASLEAWSTAKSAYIFTEDALAKGRDKAVAVWNGFPTDKNSALSSTAAKFMVEDAAFAFAFLDESLRMDSQKMVIRGSGVEGDPAQVLSSLTELALQAVAEYTQWVAETKPLTEAASMGL